MERERESVAAVLPGFFSRVAMAVIAATLLAVLALVYTTNTADAQSGGPVVLMGIDAEDGGPGGHGPISVYEDIVNDILSKAATNNGQILVIGGGKSSGDSVTTFWNQIDADLNNATVTYVNGASNISSQSFSGFEMIAVASSESETDGGLTTAENDALTNRQADIAAFVNGGNGLLGFSQTGFASPYAYVGGLGSISATGGQSYVDITPTPAGQAIGITNDLDVCCWHDYFDTFPGFLDVLATDANNNRVAAIGGADVVIGIETTKVADDPGPVAPGSQNGYTITFDNPNDEAVTLDKITDTLPPEFKYVPGSTSGATTDEPTITPNPSGDKLEYTGPFNIPANGSISLSFDVTVALTPGDYFNEADGTSQDATVAGTGPTAKITVATPQTGECTITGTSGNDVLRGTRGRDVICGLGGNDDIGGLGGDDILRGGSDNDVLHGGEGDDELTGGSGNDVLHGGPGKDELTGGSGKDALNGEGGRDSLDGKDGVKGNDSLDGGLALDTCTADQGDAVRRCEL